MTTLTATQARGNLSSLLRQALKGEDIGIVVEGKIVALRPVEVLSQDYVEAEYGVKPKRMKAIAARLKQKARKAVSTKKAKAFHGSIEALLKG